MTLIARDLMQGNPRLAELGFGEEALGHNAIAAGFQGQRQWTDHFPNGDFMEAILNSSFDWNGLRPPILMATENDGLRILRRGYSFTVPVERPIPGPIYLPDVRVACTPYHGALRVSGTMEFRDPHEPVMPARVGASVASASP